MHQTNQPRRLPIALIGAPASYHYQVALEVFGSDAELDYQPSFDAVLSAVAAGTHRGVIAIHNSIIGPVAQNAQKLEQQSTEITVIQQYDLPIEHRLVTAQATNPAQVSTVYSHPAAIAQCSTWLAAHPKISTAERADTASAAQEVCQLNDPAIAAIASPYAAKYYGGISHHLDITNQPNNVTTFAVLESATNQKDPMADLQHFRQQLNAIDADIVELLSQRSQLSRAVGALKKHHALPIHDPAREAQLVARLLKIASKQNLSTQLVHDMYTAILHNSRQIQMAVQVQEAE